MFLTLSLVPVVQASHSQRLRVSSGMFPMLVHSLLKNWPEPNISWMKIPEVFPSAWPKRKYLYLVWGPNFRVLPVSCLGVTFMLGMHTPGTSQVFGDTKLLLPQNLGHCMSLQGLIYKKTRKIHDRKALDC